MGLCVLIGLGMWMPVYIRGGMEFSLGWIGGGSWGWVECVMALVFVQICWIGWACRFVAVV